MVTNFEHSGNPVTTLKGDNLPQNPPNQPPTFPLSSPQQDVHTTFKPSNGGLTLQQNDNFLAANPFASSSSDDDSGSSSGQDEFHLERYSQETNRPGQLSQSSRKHSTRRRQQQSASKPDKRPRPGLNIVTNFSTQAKRSQTDGLVIDQVHSQRPRLGPRYATSIMSAKAEHVGHSIMEPLPNGNSASHLDNEQGSAPVGDHVPHPDGSKRSIGRQAVSRLQELQAARKKAAEAKHKEILNPVRQDLTPTQNDELHESITATSGYSPGSRSIVIGMSVPEIEAETHRTISGQMNTHSINTPDTPAIVVTPAEDTDSWTPPFFDKQRPSSVYSTFLGNEKHMQHNDLPPVPKIPLRHAHHTKSDLPTAGAIIVRSDPRQQDWYRDDLDTDDEKDYEPEEDAPKASFESQKRILPSDNISEKGRHKSQGWWNLMLSPVLSRKGTLVAKGSGKSIDTPPLPPMPAETKFSPNDTASPVLTESPETPRRLGLASARASVWSRWTSWEKERDRAREPVAALPQLKDPTTLAQDLSLVPHTAPAIDASRGLAAEYFHACAIEQLSGIQYFECRNHSCTDKLPKLQSIFDSKVTQEQSQDVDVVSRSGDQAEQGTNGVGTEGARIDRGVSIRSEPEVLSPNVRQANTAAIMKARSVETPHFAEETQRSPETDATAPRANAEAFPTQSPSSSPNLPGGYSQYPNIAAGAPQTLQSPIRSPGPVSPAMQRTMTSQGAVPMAEIHQQPSQLRLLEQTQGPSQQQAWGQTQPSSVTIHNNTAYSERSPFVNDSSVGETREGVMERLESAQSVRGIQQTSKRQEERPTAQDPEPAKKQGFLSKFKCLHRKKPSDEDEGHKKKKRRWTLIISIALFLIVLTCILLATLLTRTGDGTPVQNQWLNLTGYPPIPTGISTIARPNAVKQESQCVAPTTLWSCALPKESQPEITPNAPDQPNFRFQITFRNGTVPANMTMTVQDVARGSVLRRADDPFTDDMFEPNPKPPSRADQLFMGNTTDNITEPFDGEETPFSITFIAVFPVDPSSNTTSTSDTTRLRARQSTNTSNLIPAPDVLDDGSAAPANLLPSSPYPTSQPIKLYNRGEADEHYGFYMYYDKAIFLRSTAPINVSEFSSNNGIDPEDENGGSTRNESRLRCTFSQTRFLVRMWTNPAFGATLLPHIPGGNNTTTSETNSSATDFDRPGSFPYPTTISLDRHGGNINKKAVYCYGVDELQVIQENVRTILPELRGVDGELINPAPPLVNGSTDASNDFDQNAGGIDGGTGGCECVWQNWN